MSHLGLVINCKSRQVRSSLMKTQTLSAFICFGSSPKEEHCMTHMWRRSQEGSRCLTWLFSCLKYRIYTPQAAWALPDCSDTSRLPAHLPQKWRPWASLWFWDCWLGHGLWLRWNDLRATPLRQRKLRWWLRITSTPSTLMATSMHWTGLRTSRSTLR